MEYFDHNAKEMHPVRKKCKTAKEKAIQSFVTQKENKT